MASACVNSAATRYGWLSSRLSLSRDEHLQASIDHFEFRVEDPTAMLPADELFSGGKLVPIQLRPHGGAAVESPKAPRCSSRWRELLGLKKAHQNGETRSCPKRLLQRSSSMRQPLLEERRRVSVEAPKAARMRVREELVDSPRMNASGKIVFQFQSSSKHRARGVERSYSAHVRVLNVPLCSKTASLFGIFSSPHTNNTPHRNRTDRI